MTTGSINQSVGSISPGNCGGTALPSHVYIKSWNGGDRTGPLDKTPHNYSMYLESTQVGSGTYYGSSNPFPNCFGGVSGRVDAWTDNDDLKLQSKLVEKVRGTDFNLGLFLGTMKQTGSLIASRAKLLNAGLVALHRHLSPRGIVRALRTGLVGNPRRGSKHMADKELSALWLEASYGWIPLLQDVHGGAEALAASRDKYTSRVLRVRHSVKGPAPYGAAPSVVDVVGHQYTRKQIICNLRPSRSAKDELAILGLTDPWSVIWELTPWSFVVDWIIPIGTFLDNIHVIPKLDASYIITTKQFYSAAQTAVKDPNWRTVSPHSQVIIQLSRVVDPPLSVPVPSIKSPLSSDWRRYANAVSLLIQRWRR